MAKVAEIEDAEKEKMRLKCKKIIDHGINCFINRQLIYNFPEQIFTDAGVISIEHADFDGIERLAAVTGGEIASTFDKYLLLPSFASHARSPLFPSLMLPGLSW
jgi:T-complex protein 1 subunit beta